MHSLISHIFDDNVTYNGTDLHVERKIFKMENAERPEAVVRPNTKRVAGTFVPKLYKEDIYEYERFRSKSISLFSI